MKTLYLECSMGAAGDMLTAALLELLPDPQLFLRQMNALGLDGVTVSAESVSKQGIQGTQMHVLIGGTEETVHDAHTHHHEAHGHHHAHHHDHPHPHEHHHEHHHEHSHHHASMRDVTEQIKQLSVSDSVKQHALEIYRLIAEAESHAHGCEITEIHFHEVGTQDAIADIIGVCLLMELLAPERVAASPVHVGSGHVHCAHGILPVPAPATAYLLRDIPMYGGAINGELCTPTGAAILRHFVSKFGAMPVMKTQKIGYGIGKKEFARMNCVRAFWGETDSDSEQILELVCNLDDMTGESLGFAQEQLLEAGALDVYTVPTMMKKGRPAYMLTCLCRPAQRDIMLQVLFRHTATLGVRERLCQRYTLDRISETLETPFGAVRIKQASGYGVTRSKAEYDDLARIAREQNRSLDDIRRAAEHIAEI